MSHTDFRWSAIAVAAICLSMPFGPTYAQLRFDVEEINPDQPKLKTSGARGSGGRVSRLAVAAQGNLMFAASEWGGLFRSTDLGNTWRHLPGHVPTATWDVAIDPESAKRVYATSFYDSKFATLAGISVSLDGGTSWTRPLSATPPAGFCLNEVRRDEPSAFGISINPENPNNVAIGTNCGLAISDDRGVTWRFVDPTPADGADDVWDVVLHHGGIIDLIGDDGHQRSIDAGATFTTAGILPGGISSIAVSPDEANVLFATTGTSVWQSADAGATWDGFGNPSPQGRIPFVKTNQRAGASFDLWFGDIRLHRATCTTPAGGGPGNRCPEVSTWISVNDGAHPDMGDVVFDPQAADDACPLAVSSDGGVYINSIRRSPDCHNAAWTHPAISPHALWLWDLSGASYPGALNDVVIGKRSSFSTRYEIRDDAAAGFSLTHVGGTSWGQNEYPTSIATGDFDGDGLTEYIIGRRANLGMRYEILDDAAAGFAQLHNGGGNWGFGQFPTSIATGDFDGDGLDEVIIGRRSSIGMRYEILDDAKAGFAQMHAGGAGWSSFASVSSVATGDVDGDGLDEVVIGRQSDFNTRYQILDDAKAGFALIHSGGLTWGVGQYTTAVATGNVDNDGRDEVIIGRRATTGMRYEILDDRTAGFAQIHTGGSGLGAGYTTALATGDVDGDGRDEVIAGRQSNSSVRYEILDDRTAHFAQMHSGGAEFGAGDVTRSVAAGDLDNDGKDEVVIGRSSILDLRYEILDDAGAGFAQIHKGGSGWLPGSVASAVAVGSIGGNRLDLHFGNQDNGTYASTNAESLKPTWRNVDGGDSFDVPSTLRHMLVTICCFTEAPETRLYLRRPGMLGNTEVNPPPNPLRSFAGGPHVAMFGPKGAAVSTLGVGVFITNDITASPVAWTQLGVWVSTNVGRLTAITQASGTTFFVSTGAVLKQLWRYAGTAPGGTWQEILPPGGEGGFGIFAVDPQNALRIAASHARPGMPSAMMITSDGGANWDPLPALDVRMNGGGLFRAQTQRGPTAFTAFGSYSQTQLFEFSPRDPNLMVAGGADSGVFLSADAGASWSLVSDPLTPAISGIPHIPRPHFAHFDHLPDTGDVKNVDIYLGTRGRGVFRIRASY